MTGDSAHRDGPDPAASGPRGHRTDADEAGAPPIAPTSRRRDLLSALLANRLAAVGLVVLALVLLAAVTGDLLAPRGPTDIPSDLAERQFQPPSLEHPFGTDNQGRDVLSRVIAGARVSIVVAVSSVGFALVTGVGIGLVAGFYGRWVDDLLMRLSDVLFSFPPILLALAILAILRPLGLTTEAAVVAIGVAFAPIFARITRGSVLSVRETVYVRAARSIGAGSGRIIRRHVLPNVLAPIIVQTSLSLAFAILVEAALSFLGLGVPPPTPAWGRMLSEGRDFLTQGWWIAFFPGMAIFLTVLSFNVVGDALRDALDPKQRSAIEARGRDAG